MDARVRYTKRVIRESFFKLLKEKPVNKITVKSICELSEINRATFYKYYSNPFDLIEQIEDDFILQVQQLIKNTDDENITQTMIVILNAIRDHSEIYMLLISKNGDGNFLNRLITESYAFKISNTKTLLPDLSQTHLEWIYNFMSHGCISIFVAWVHHGMHEEASEVAEFINRLNAIMLNGLQV